jgi:hypothetical protein
LAKLLRLARINRLLQRLEQEYEGLAAVLKVQKIMLSIVFVAHMVACFWYYVGTETRVGVGTTTAASHPDEAAGVELFEVFGGGDSISNPGGILEGWVVKNGWCDPIRFLLLVEIQSARTESWRTLAMISHLAVNDCIGIRTLNSNESPCGRDTWTPSTSV